MDAPADLASPLDGARSESEDPLSPFDEAEGGAPPFDGARGGTAPFDGARGGTADAVPDAAPDAQRLLALVEALDAIDDTQALLDRIAEASAALAGYRVAVLSAYLPEGALLGGHGIDATERTRFVRSMSTTPLESRLSKRERIRSFAFPGTGIAFVPHTADLARSAAFCASAAAAGGSWHPEDRLFLLVRTGRGEEIGVLSLDEPLDGEAPTVSTLSRLRLAERLLGFGASLLANRVLARDLRASEATHRALVQGAPVGIYRWRDGRCVSANPRLAGIFGYASPDALLADPAFPGRLDARDRAALEAATGASGEVRGFALSATRLDGTPVRLRVTTRLDGETGTVHGIVEDVTEALRLEEHLQRAQRVEAVGTLASGVAHDFNNLLAGVLGWAAILVQRLEGDEALSPMAKSIQDSALRAADLTRQLLGLARPGAPEDARADVVRALEDCARVARETFDPRVVTTLSVEEGLPVALADPGEVHRAVLNLCVNARDAMPAGGALSLSAAADAVGPRSTPSAPRRPLWIRIDVRDTGTGMEDAVLARLFEPFFTTKPRGKGTGLGLYGVFRATKAYGGAVEVDSRPGAGTCFHLYFPAADALRALPPALREAPRPIPALSGGEHILVVEDEEPVRRVARHVLEEAGFAVETASDGEEALRLVVEAPGAWDLVLLDLRLPLVAGADVLRALRRARPDVPVLLSSGNVSEGLEEPDVRDGVAGVLGKPWLPAELLAAVGRVLSRRARAAG